MVSQLPSKNTAAHMVELQPAGGLSLRIAALDATDQGLVVSARELLREYGDFILAATGPARYRAARLDEEIDSPLATYKAKNGELLLALAGDTPVGCAGYRALEGDVPEHACELKRMWVRPRFRGSGYGDRLAHAVFARAAASGYKAIYLDTEPTAMPEAVRLYRRVGFEPCPPYATAVADGLQFFRRTLP